MQLTTIIVPSLEAMKKEGPAGQRKITQYTRYATVVLATFQALGISVALEAQPGLVIDPGMAFQVYTVITLVTGTMFLMWLGEQITERGLGNGISIIIFAGIVSGLPSAVGGFPFATQAQYGWSHPPHFRFVDYFVPCNHCGLVYLGRADQYVQ
jgi:preprotein translocase subunit SecY